MQRLLIWIRSQLVVIIFAAILVLQYLNWQAIRDLGSYLPRSPPRCDSYDPCVVELAPYTLKQLRP